jgi:hypothetical protein
MRYERPTVTDFGPIWRFTFDTPAPGEDNKDWRDCQNDWMFDENSCPSP